MKAKFAKLIPIVFISLTLFLNVGRVEGVSKSVVWNTVYQPGYPLRGSFSRDTTTVFSDLVNGFGPLGGEVLADPNISVIYKAKLFNNVTNEEIVDGTNVSLGTVIRVERDISTLNTDVYWFGTGYSADSPYGSWIQDARYPTTAPTCSSINFVGMANNHYNQGGYNSDYAEVYIPFSVNPTNTSVVNNTPTSISCIGNLCTVNAAGAIMVEMNFTDTYGRFYYGYIDTLRGSGCVTSSYPVYMCTGLPGKFGCAGAYTAKVLVPAQTITFNLTAVSNNNPPLPPTITGVSSANLGTTNTFTFNATDPDGDTIYYRIDWNNDGVGDGLSPASGNVTSGTNSTSNYTLPSTGTTFTFKARTVDSNGGVSAWTTYTVTLLQAINGECGQANGEILSSAPSGAALCFTPGAASSVTTNATTWTWTCSGTNGGNVSPTCTTTKQGPTVNLWFSLFDRVKLFTGNLISNSTLIDRVLAKEIMK